MDLTTPKFVSKEIITLCEDIEKRKSPFFVDVRPAQKALINECYENVRKQVKEEKGKIVYGWQVWEWPNVMIEAEFHAIWNQSNGGFLDITPKSEEIDQILFLPSDNIYRNQQINSIRRALKDDKLIHDFIQAAEDEFEFMNRGSRKGKHKLSLSQQEAKEYKEILNRKAEKLMYLKLCN